MATFACLILTHTDPDLTRDTLAAVRRNVTDDVVVVVDGKHWGDFAGVDFGVRLLRGHPHGLRHSPYRNQLVGLRALQNLYPGRDWYCHAENDTLFASPAFKDDLPDAWAAGFDLRLSGDPWPSLSRLLRRDITSSAYLLGCCQFYRGDFLAELKKLDFFNLVIAAGGPRHPDWRGYSAEEGLLPSMARHLGGRLAQLACWPQGPPRYGVRPKPVWEAGEVAGYPSILHPCKKLDRLRAYYAALRE